MTQGVTDQWQRPGARLAIWNQNERTVHGNTWRKNVCLCPLSAGLGLAGKSPSWATLAERCVQSTWVWVQPQSPLPQSPLWTSVPSTVKRGQRTYFPLWSGASITEDKLEESSYFCLINFPGGVLGTTGKSLFSSLMTQMSCLLEQSWAPIGSCTQLCLISFLREKCLLQGARGDFSAKCWWHCWVHMPRHIIPCSTQGRERGPGTVS